MQGLLQSDQPKLMVIDIGESAQGMMMKTKSVYFAYSKSKVGSRVVRVVRTETLLQQMQRKTSRKG